MNNPNARSPIVETGQDARQGRLGFPVWVVLAASTTLVAILFAIIWLYFAGGADVAPTL